MNSDRPITTEYTLTTRLPYWDESSRGQPSQTFALNGSLLQTAFWAEACFAAIKEISHLCIGRENGANRDMSVIISLAEIGEMLTGNQPTLVEELTDSIKSDHDLDFPEEVS